jgi:Plasmid pRiA4b ORF-3-like protein
LHHILQIAMGWTDSHLHQFEAKGQIYGEPNPELELTMKDEARVRLEQLLTGEKQSLLYEYDFGDSWTHQVALEKILTPSAEVREPWCVGEPELALPKTVGVCTAMPNC